MIASAESTLTYLLAEDNDSHADLIERCFRLGNSLGHIHRARSGLDCLAYLDTSAANPCNEPGAYPSVVLMDIKMSGPFDGLHTLMAIRADPRHRSLPVIMLTSSDRERDIHRARELGADGYIVKSYDTNEMIERLQHIQPPFTFIDTITGS